jgi:hypothetical protein
VPADWSDAQRAQKEVQARWTKKHGKSFYGYKLHANTDRRWGFIRQHEVSAANVHDSQHFETIRDPAARSLPTVGTPIVNAKPYSRPKAIALRFSTKATRARR